MIVVSHRPFALIEQSESAKHRSARVPTDGSQAPGARSRSQVPALIRCFMGGVPAPPSADSVAPPQLAVANTKTANPVSRRAMLFILLKTRPRCRKEIANPDAVAVRAHERAGGG
jgi:hypothetical protein